MCQLTMITRLIPRYTQNLCETGPVAQGCREERYSPGIGRLPVHRSGPRLYPWRWAVITDGATVFPHIDPISLIEKDGLERIYGT